MNLTLYKTNVLDGNCEGGSLVADVQVPYIGHIIFLLRPLLCRSCLQINYVSAHDNESLFDIIMLKVGHSVHPLNRACSTSFT